MMEKVPIRPKKGDPKVRPLRRPDPQESTPKSVERENPPRDTREAPAPNPNGEHAP